MDGKAMVEAFMTGFSSKPSSDVGSEHDANIFKDVMKIMSMIGATAKPKTESEISEKLKADLAAAPVASGIPVFRAKTTPEPSPIEECLKLFTVIGAPAKPKTEGEVAEKLKADLAAAPVATASPASQKEASVSTDQLHKLNLAIAIAGLSSSHYSTIISALNLRNAPFSGFKSKKHARHFLFTIFDTTNYEIKEKLRSLSVILAECL